MSATTISVPSRIVIGGTSTISLNERFSNLPKPKTQIVRPVVKQQQVIRRIGHQTIFRKPVTRFNRSRPVLAARDEEELLSEEDDVDEQEEIDYLPEHYGYVKYPGPRRFAGRFRKPIDQRIALVRKGRGFGARNGHNNYHDNQLKINPRADLFKRALFGDYERRPNNHIESPWRRGYNGFKKFNGNSGNRFGRRGGQKSLTDLDRELDEYMRKPSGKHEPITAN